MTWTKLSDDFSDDCWTLSDAAFRLHIEGLVWSNRKLLDCVLRKDELRRWASRPDAAQELLDAGWWVDNGDTYTIRHHATYQRDREAVLNRQEVNRRNGRRGGRPPVREQAATIQPPEPTETHSVNESLSESKTHRDGTGQDGIRPLREAVQTNENGSARCRYCDSELSNPERIRGYCHRAHCLDDAKAELS